MEDKYNYLNAKFWTDQYIESLSPEGKLLYNYLLTGPLKNLICVYEISVRQMSFHTGLSEDTIVSIVTKLEADKKVLYVDGWIVLCNGPKNQKYKGEKLGAALSRQYGEIPAKIREKIIFNEYPIDTLSIPYQYPIDTLSIPLDKSKREKLKGKVKAVTPTFSYAPADAGAPKKSGRTPEGGNPPIFKGDPSTSFLVTKQFYEKAKKTPGDPAKVTEMLERIAQGVGLSSWRDLRETEEWKRNHGSQLVELCEKLTPEVFWSRFDEMLEDHAEGWKNPRFVYEDIKAYTNADEELAVLRQASGYIRAISVFPLDPEADPNDKPGKPRVERVYDLPENKIIREAFFVVLPYVEKPDTIGWSEKWQDFKSRGEAYSAVKILEFSKALLASLEKDPAYKKFCSEAWYQKWREKLAATWGW